MKANGTFPPAIELGSTPSGRIFHAFHHMQLVPTPDLLQSPQAG